MDGNKKIAKSEPWKLKWLQKLADHLNPAGDSSALCWSHCIPELSLCAGNVSVIETPQLGCNIMMCMFGNMYGLSLWNKINKFNLIRIFSVSIYVGWSGDWMLGGYRYKGFIVCGFSWFVFCAWDWGWRFSGIIHVLYYSTCNLCFEYVFCILSLLCAPDHGAV